MDEELQYAVLHEFVAPARRNLSRRGVVLVPITAAKVRL